MNSTSQNNVGKSTKKSKEVNTEKVTEVINNIAEEVFLENTEEKLSQFVFMDKVRTILDLSVETGKNVILHGRGGYGKSEFTEAYLNARGITPYTITMGSGMTTDRLFGGVDLKQFHDSGKIEYLIENSFMAHEYVVFEELFDAPDFILEQLKDIISSGVFRNGNQVFEIKTKNIICCTNKTREEFSKNNSLKALMERFPLEMEVKWENHNAISYTLLLEAKFGENSADPMLIYILDAFSRKGIFISPRIAIVAAELMNVCGPSCFEFIADFKSQDKLLKDSILKFESISKVSEKVRSLKAVISEVEEIMDNQDFGIHKKLIKNLIAKAVVEIDNLKAVKVDDTMAVSIAKQITDFEIKVVDLKKAVKTNSVMTDVMSDNE